MVVQFLLDIHRLPFLYKLHSPAVLIDHLIYPKYKVSDVLIRHGCYCKCVVKSKD